MKTILSDIRVWLVAIIIIIAIIPAVSLINKLNSTAIIDPHPQSERIQKELQNDKTAQFLTDIAPRKIQFTAEEKKLQPPQFDIKKYLTQAALPQLNKDITIYEFKTNFSANEATALAQKLLSGQIRQTENKHNNTIIFANGSGQLVFNLTTGGFTVQTLGTKIPIAAGLDNNQKMAQVKSYLQTIGVIDDTIEPTAYYIRNNDTNTVYIEFHRTNVDLPIYNPFALVTVPDSQKINTLSFTKFSPTDPDDKSITYASDKPGKARKTDFNSLTVTLTSIPETNEAYVLAIDSNIRPIVKRSPLSSQHLTLLDPSKIISELKNGSYFNMTLPSGVGKMDLKKVYPNNTFITNTATITDMSLAYFEKPGIAQQRYLQPGYLVKGYGETETGIRVNFSQVVPAVDDPSLYAKTDDNLLARLAKSIGAFLTPASFAQTLQSQTNSFNCREGDTSYWCNLETFKNTPTPAPPTSPPTGVPTSVATPTPAPPTAVPTPPPGTIKPCTLYDLKGNLLEEAYEFVTPALTLEGHSASGDFVQEVKPIRIAYFKALPNGPLAYRDETYTGPINYSPRSISASLVDDSTPEAKEFRTMVIIEMNIRGAQVLKAHPELAEGLTVYTGEYVTIDVHKLFPEVTLDMSNTDIQFISNATWGYLTAAISNTRGWTIDSLAAQPHPLANVPLQALFTTRFFRGIGIFPELSQKYQLDPRCHIISPVSPSVYFYSKKPTNVTFIFDHQNVTYSDPYVPQTGSKITVDGDMFTINDTDKRRRLYYEYTNVNYDKPPQGWIIEEDKLDQFIKNHLATQLALTPIETDDLVKDVAASTLNANKKKYVFVSLLPESEVSNKLPFEIKPQPSSLRRIHVFIEYTDTKELVNPPQLKPVTRGNFTVVELGVYVNKK